MVFEHPRPKMKFDFFCTVLKSKEKGKSWPKKKIY